MTTTTASLRSLSCELAPLHNAKGSCLWKSGGTHVLAALHGPSKPRLPPHELPHGQVSVLVQGSSNSTTQQPLREWEEFLHRQLSQFVLLDQYPRSIIQVTLQILTHDGGALAACWHAALAALMDAGIALESLPVAITCAVLPNEERVQLDPSMEQEQGAGVAVVLVLPGVDDRILGLYSTGAMPANKLLECCSIAEQSAPAVAAFWRLAIEQRATRENQTLWAM